MSNSHKDINRSRFYGPSGWLTQALFWEMADNRSEALYTLKPFDIERDGKVYKSFYRMFMSCSDPTEYEFAVKHLGGWQHWQHLQNLEWMVSKVDTWREEFSVRLRALAIGNVIDQAMDGDSPSFQANKFLTDKGWIEKTPAGRPSKKQVKENLKEIDKVKGIIKADITKLQDYKKNKNG